MKSMEEYEEGGKNHPSSHYLQATAINTVVYFLLSYFWNPRTAPFPVCWSVFKFSPCTSWSSEIIWMWVWGTFSSGEGEGMCWWLSIVFSFASGEKQKLPTENSVLFLKENKPRSHCAEMGDRVLSLTSHAPPLAAFPYFLSLESSLAEITNPVA